VKRHLRLLIVDDSADHASQLIEALRDQGYEIAHTVAGDPAAMRSELERQQWDVIVSGHALPNVDAAAALTLAKQLQPDVPFIIVSAGIDLDLAVSLIKAGAQDYVQRSQLTRLGRVIERELRDAETNRERRYDRKRLSESGERFKAIVENVGDLVAMLNTEGRRVYNSPSYRLLFRDEELQLGSNSFQEIHPEDRERIRAVFQRTVATGIGERAEFRFVLRDGRFRHIESEGRAIHDAKGNVSGVIVVSRDITERRRMESELRELAITDPLTGLPNRRHFLARLDEELARIQRIAHQCTAVLMVDLDNFKQVNDRFGHAAGDEALKHFAALTRAELRKIDSVGRIGGEEFAIVLPGAGPTAAEVFASRLCRKVAESTLVLNDQVIRLTVSIGVAAMDAADADTAVSLKRADQALYRAKASGRNRVEVCAEAGEEPLLRA
jgi:diguanylate cyclase (GGDEF)-like protein/PAS domain S-box-containing protein